MTQEQIKEAVKRFKEGQVIIFPTETVMGIGCAITSAEGIRRVYALKGRPQNQPTHVLVSNVVMAGKLGYINNPKALDLIHNFWPGPLTLVVGAHAKWAPREILNEDRNIGIRMPAHKDLLEIIEQLGVGVLGPSANLAGEEPPIKVSQIDKTLKGRVDYVIEQNALGSMPSTIVEVSRYNWRILRSGPISETAIRKALEE